MKLNTHAFPYPVLTHDEGAGADYRDSGFQCPLIFSLEENKGTNLKIDYAFLLTNDEINALITNGYASFALEIKCANTVNREIRFLEKEGSLSLNASDFYGKIEFTPMVITRQPYDNFTSPDLNEEFNNATFNLSMGDVLAIDDTRTQFIEFNDLSFSSLVKVREDQNLDPLQYEIESDPSFIWIKMDEEMKKLWDRMRQDKNWRPAIMMSIYKDVVFFALEELARDSESSDSRWAISLESKMAKLGYQIPKDRNFNTINIVAQNLVKKDGVKELFEAIGD